jgi:hypothetical protein
MSKETDDYINIFPDLNCKKSIKKNIVPKKLDSDVDLIINKNFKSDDILTRSSQKTHEENSELPDTEKTTKSRKWNYIIICLSVIVVILIVVLVWFNLKKNVVKPTDLNLNLLHPGQIAASKIANDQIAASKIANDQIAASKIANDQITASKIASGQIKKELKPSKKDLLSTLNNIKLETINENANIMNNSNAITKQSQTDNAETDNAETDNAETDNAEADNAEADSNLNKQFIKNMEQNITIDEMDEADETDSADEADEADETD